MNESTIKTAFDLCKSHGVDASALRVAGAATLALAQSHKPQIKAPVDDDDALLAAVNDMAEALDKEQLIESIVWASWVMQARAQRTTGATTDELVRIREQLPRDMELTYHEAR